MKNRINVFIIGMFITFFLVSCSRQVTIITGTWTRDELDESYDHILVVALSGNVEFKSILEEAVVEHIRQKENNAFKSIDILPPKFIEDEDQKQKILENIQTDGIDGILTVSIISKETETRYVPGSYYFAPYPRYSFYGNFWTYYDYWYSRFYEPGYYTKKTYFLESNLYDAESQNLVWSAQSRVYNPRYFETFSEEFAEKITATLDREDIIEAN